MRLAYPKVKIRITAAILAVMFVLAGVIISEIYLPLGYGRAALRDVIITPGLGLSDISSTLKENGIISNKYFFQIYVKISGNESSMKAGRYKLSPDMSIYKITLILSKGLAESDDVTIVIPEGINVWEIEKRLLDVGLIEKAGDFVRLHQKDEGYLFPDTYRFDKKLKEDSSKEKNPDIIAGIMKDNFYKKVGYIEPDVLITASLLEKEGRQKIDMEIISGIIQKRLKLGMLLQLDATVAYGWCLKSLLTRKYDPPCDVTLAPISKEIPIDGLYNSYIQKGLPPGPISNPGLISINAARNPRQTDYLYYLSTRDDGQIIYAKTGAEHIQNRHTYLGL